jgi:hypothetical protein
MDDDDAQAIVYQLEKQRDATTSLEEAVAKLEASIAQGHHAILGELRSLNTPIAIAVLALLATAVGVWWRYLI